jgi:methylmalonyl-CoA mutase cobalamin-binding subunit
VTSQLRQLLPAPQEPAPAALGGAPAGDPYLLPSMMAAAVLAEAGYRETNYGANTPVGLLATAAAEQRASVVWLSVSAADAAAGLRPEIESLAERLGALHATLLLGGRHALDILGGEPIPNVRLLHSMRELAAFRPSVPPPTPLA